MAIPKRNARGLQDMRTHSGRVDQASLPYMAYMRLSCLEMEKFRRGEERKSAMHRIGNIDARFKEIEAEKARLLRSLPRRKRGNSNGVSRVESKPQRSTGGLKLKY